MQDDAELIALAKVGKQGAFDEVIRRHQDIAFRVALVLLGDPEMAADATQEAIIKAYRALPRFDPGRPFRPWLLRIVANEARDSVRSRRRRETFTVSLAQQQPPAASRSPEDTVVADDERRQLAAALNRLSPGDRQAVAMRYFLGLSEREMAEALNCRQGTVKSRLSRALSRLRLVMTEKEEPTLPEGVTINA